MKRPILLILLSFVIGIWAGQYVENFTVAALFAILAFFAFLALGGVRGRGTVCMLILPAIVGVFLYMGAASPPDPRVNSFADSGKTIKISGRVRSVSYSKDSGSSRFVFEGRLFRLEKEYVKKKILIRAYCSGQVKPGDMLVLSGRLEKPQTRKNPSDFNRRSYMYARGQYYIMNVDNVWLYGNKQTIYTLTQRLKDKVSNNFYSLLPEKEAALMCGMVVGDTGDIDDNVSELYKKTGIYHVLAISGLHIGLLGGALLKLFSFMGKTRSRLFAAAFLALYCVMTGCSISVIRAIIMLCVLLFGKFISREYDLISSAAFTACIVLLRSPFYLFDAGFLFSFLAVAAIGAVTDIGNIYRKHRAVITGLGINIAADLATKPVTMYNFFYINPLSVLANFFLVPLMSLCVGFGFVLAVLGFISRPLSELAAIPVFCILRAVEALCTAFTSLSASYLVTGRPNMALILIYAVILAVIYYSAEKGSFKNIPLFVCIFILTVFLAVLGKNISRNPRVSFVDVGQGDCAVGTVGELCFMVDGGSTRDNVGQNTILPYILYRGIDRVDAVFVSHTDKDHINGITDIIGRIEIGKIYLPYGFEENDGYKRLKKKALENGVVLKTLKEGDKIYFGNSAYMEVLYPLNGVKADGNNGSMVAKFRCDGGAVLFTGDIEAEGERALLSKNKAVDADILKLAHHGSKGSNTKELLEAVRPRYAVASAESSVYKHPSGEVIAELDKMGVPCYITEYTGEVSFEFEMGSVKEPFTYCKEKNNE